VGREGNGRIVCRQQIFLGGFYNVPEGNGREWEIVCSQKFVLGGLDKWWEAKGKGELCVDSRFC